VYFGWHDTNVLSFMTAAVNNAGLAVLKAGRPAVKRAVGSKTNPVNAVSSDDDSHQSRRPLPPAISISPSRE
jgi:hypothetical protein